MVPLFTTLAPAFKVPVGVRVAAHAGIPLSREIVQAMSLLSWLFGKNTPTADTPAFLPANDDRLIPVPVPALGVLLLNLEKQKGAPLSEAEVIEARDKAVCMMLPLSAKVQMDEKRGYRDIDPENVWAAWLAFKAEAQRSAR